MTIAAIENGESGSSVRAKLNAVIASVNTASYPEAFGAVGDGVTDDSVALRSAANSGNVIALARNKVYYVNTSISVSSWKLVGYDGGRIRLGPNGFISVENADKPFMLGCEVFGGMTGAQYSVGVTGASVVAAFGSPVYKDESNATIDGSDFTHTLAGNQITVGLGSLTGAKTRTVVSARITIDPSRKYVAHQDGVIVTQSGALLGIRFYAYDASDVLIGEYDPNDSTGTHSFISGATYVRFAVSLQRDAGTASGLTSILQLDKLQLLKCENEAHALNVASPPYTQFQFYASPGLVVRDCTFRYMPCATVVFISCDDAQFVGNIVAQCWEGPNYNSCSHAIVSENSIDLRQIGPSGVLYPLKFYRYRCVKAYQCPEFTVVRNRLIGAPWAVECVPMTGLRVAVSDNYIDAEYNGISIDGGTQAEACRNTIRLVGGFGGTAIEMASAHIDARVSGNSVWIENATRGYGYGVVLDNATHTRGEVSNNWISAPFGIFTPGNASTTQMIVGNTVLFAASGIYTQTAGAIIRGNNLRKVGSMRSNFTASTALEISSGVGRFIVESNYIEKGDAAFVVQNGGTLSSRGNTYVDGPTVTTD